MSLFIEPLINKPVPTVTYQQFYTHLLAQGVVTKLEVVEKSLVRVYIPENINLTKLIVTTNEKLRSGNANVQQPKWSSNGDILLRAFRTMIGWQNPKEQESQSALLVYKNVNSSHVCNFKIGSVDTFERRLDEAQQSLGWKQEEYIPVEYQDREYSWYRLLGWLPFSLWLLISLLRVADVLEKGGPMGMFQDMRKAKYTVIEKDATNKVTFSDVAGCEEAKQEVTEFVHFLQNPEKYTKIGARMPRGALLVGPPGTGKTLLAKAVAGEANVPFLSISGTDFVEVWVGLGSSRVRDLFAQARKRSPSIIFIDEIDAIGRARQDSRMSSSQEHENTLNQILVEMDGFSTSEGVVVMAATNRADVLDSALLRPGRFDRQIHVDLPDVNGRAHIFRVHLKTLKMDKPLEEYSQRLAALTPGFSGADVANVCNEAALIAVRNNKEQIGLLDFESAVDRVIGGLEKKGKKIQKSERRTVAYHEAGHAVVGWFLEHADPLLKVSIVPRGSAALGFSQYLPNENVLMSTEQMMDTICMALGGRAAEQVIVGRVSTGAQNDLEKVTKIAYSHVSVYGFNEKVGLLSFPPKQELSKPYSEDTARIIDQEVRNMVNEAYNRTLDLIRKYREQIEALAQELIQKEVVGLDDLERILGERPFQSEEVRNVDVYRSYKKAYSFEQGNGSTPLMQDNQVQDES
eukprot:TRINITY_DN8104_c0_g1_i4.p1 TRINITY_DN8104_c0_g1~~TRINITY_DN8104_c0_g1_i4.p1  ORF type:complete len:688 (-),score=79.63 TRINITY_DN8104_c0_g1_i4:322-2385(-)